MTPFEEDGISMMLPSEYNMEALPTQQEIPSSDELRLAELAVAALSLWWIRNRGSSRRKRLAIRARDDRIVSPD